MNRQGKTCEVVEERVQSDNKAFWNIMIYKSKDVLWRVCFLLGFLDAF